MLTKIKFYVKVTSKIISEINHFREKNIFPQNYLYQKVTLAKNKLTFIKKYTSPKLPLQKTYAKILSLPKTKFKKNTFKEITFPKKLPKLRLLKNYPYQKITSAKNYHFKKLFFQEINFKEITFTKR